MSRDPVPDVATERYGVARPEPPAPDPHRWLRPPRPRGWLPVMAAASVIAVIAMVGILLIQRDRTVPLPIRDDVVVFSAPDPALDWQDLIIRDGDEAQATGEVMTDGENVRFCAPAQTLAISPAGIDQECPFYVLLSGLDPASVGPEVTLRGVWRAGTDLGRLFVTHQESPGPAPAEDASSEVPCPSPTAGWSPAGLADSKALHSYVYDEHPEQFRAPSIGYPDPGSPATAVMIVEVVRGDVDEAREELQRRYAGNLCVVSRRGGISLDDLSRLQREVRPAVDALQQRPENGIYGTGNDEDSLTVDLVILTPELYDEFAQLDQGWIDLNPWLRPV